MYKDGKYRFNLTLPVGKDADMVGLILEKLGHKKSQYIVFAMLEYMDNHPKLKEEWLRSSAETFDKVTEIPMETDMVPLITKLVLDQLKNNSPEMIMQLLSSKEPSALTATDENKNGRESRMQEMRLSRENNDEEEGEEDEDDESAMAMLSAFSGFGLG